MEPIDERAHSGQSHSTQALGFVTAGDVAKDHLILVHGFTQNGRSWRHIADQLAHSYHITTIDLPGHGLSTLTLATDLTDTARLVGNTGGQGTYIGYSLGGRVCLALALLRPDLVRRLVLISASPGIKENSEREQRARADGVLADRLDPSDTTVAPLHLDEFLNEWLAGPLFAHLTDAQADRESRMTNAVRGLAESLRSAGVGRQQPLFDQLSSLTMPVCCIAGANDVRFTDTAHEMAATIGNNATVAIVEHAGHSVPFEQPVETVKLLNRFLSETVPKRNSA